MSESGKQGGGAGSGALGMSKRRREALGESGGDRGREAATSVRDGGGAGRRRKQNRRIPGKSGRPEYTQASAHIREAVYDHVVNIIRGDPEIREILRNRCNEMGVSPGGGKPAYGYSELVELLLLRWAEEEAGDPYR